MSDQRTRHSQRQKKFAPLLRNIDQDLRLARYQSYIDVLESDYYDSPNKLAEDELSDDFDANAEQDDDRRGRKKKGSISKNSKKTKKKKIPKKVKQNAQIRRNLNLKKILKEQTQVSEVFANFTNIRTTTSCIPRRRYCSICGVIGKYTCPRCSESYCSMACNHHHKEIQCLRVDF